MAGVDKTVLVADDDASMRTVLSHALKREGYQVEVTDNGATLYRWITEGRGDVVITDVLMPGENGLDLIPKIRKRRPDMKVIVISAQNPMTTAMTAQERGAMDCLSKPFNVDELLSLVKTALMAPKADEQDNIDTLRAVSRSFVMGQSPVMQDIYRQIARLRNSDLTVLITGESGTGKEVVARLLHQYSRWSEGPFVAVNMAAIPRELIESELFGHEKGAFTGAVQRAVGRFEQAAGGTLFLDEIGDMPFEAQTRLLRVLQEGEFNTIGGHRLIKTHVRIVAATNKNLADRVRKGSFREDLYYRLNVIPVHVPPLRERMGDIPALVQHFILQADATKVFDPAAMREIERHRWAGNVRELESFTKRLAVLHPQDIIDAATVKTELAKLSAGGDVRGDEALDLEQRIMRVVKDWLESKGQTGTAHEDILRLFEKPLIEEVLRLTQGNQIKAADFLGLNRNTLRSRIKELGVEIKRNS